MSKNRIDIVHFGLQEGNGWLRAAWPLLAAAYHDSMRANADKVERFAYLTALKLVSTQIADAHNLPCQDVQPQVEEQLAKRYEPQIPWSNS